MKSVCTKIWKFSWCLDSLEFIKNSREFSRNFTSRSRSRGIFISLFTLGLDLETFSFHFSLSISISRHFHFTFHSRNGWTRFLFHFSLLEMSEPDFHFTFHFSNFQYPLSQDTATSLMSSFSFATSWSTTSRASLARDLRPSWRCITPSQWSSRSGLERGCWKSMDIKRKLALWGNIPGSAQSEPRARLQALQLRASNELHRGRKPAPPPPSPGSPSPTARGLGGEHATDRGPHRGRARRFQAGGSRCGELEAGDARQRWQSRGLAMSKKPPQSRWGWTGGGSEGRPSVHASLSLQRWKQNLRQLLMLLQL